MLFNSIEFLFFFIVVTTLFFVLPHKARWILLLAASCFFYMFFRPVYIFILFFTIVIDYFAGIYLEKTEDPVSRRWLLILSLLANIGVLVVFKYFNFINANVTGLGQFFGFKNPIPHLDIILPIGLSFHTFQAMSYTIEVYKRRVGAEKHFGLYALYVMFYPQLVAGPIERPQHILPQFRIKQYFNFQNAAIGLNLIFWGLFKKIVIADRLAIYVNQVFGNIDQASSISAFLAVIFFSFQIYCDFSGYSDIARGTAKVMGYDLMVNFRQPYLSRSFSEFWGRWHISLSTWFRDYLYIPLGGSREGQIKKLRNLFIVFMISGLWHGANWTFLIWGFLHALFLITENLTLNARISIIKKLRIDRNNIIYKGVSVIFVFMMVSLAWVFFRADNIEQAFQFFRKLTAFDLHTNMAQLSAFRGPLNLILTFLVVILLLCSRRIPEMLEKRGSIAIAVVSTFLIILFGPNESGQFIYFQF